MCINRRLIGELVPFLSDCNTPDSPLCDGSFNLKGQSARLCVKTLRSVSVKPEPDPREGPANKTIHNRNDCSLMENTETLQALFFYIYL